MSDSRTKIEAEAFVARLQAKAEERRRELEQEGKPSQPQEEHEGKAQKPAELIHMGAKALEANLKLEQNLGCEFPVCVSNRQRVHDEYIETVTDRGTWRLSRTADSLLPAPEHYPYWLWFLDRCHAAYEQGAKDAPCIVLNPPELFELFGMRRNGAQGRGRGGFYYDDLDNAFTRFGRLVISQRGALYLKGVGYHGRTIMGTLCNYSSWRATPTKDQEVLEFMKGWIQPGPVVWGSIRAGYLKSCPSFERLLPLGYVSQRLTLFLAKHCPPGGEYTISAAKLLQRIPMTSTPDQVRKHLRSHHEALLATGFLDRIVLAGRGDLDRIMLTYVRPPVRQ